MYYLFFFFKHKTAYEWPISDWSSDVCSSDLPEMDGYTATSTIREMPQYEKLPIIAVTAKAMLGDRDKSLASGANDYVRSEERRVGKECVRTCRSRWWPYH